MGICTCSSISEHQMPGETTCSCTDPDICACILRTDIIPTLLAEIRLAGQLYQEQLEDQAKLDVKVLDYQVADMGRLPSQSTENGESSIPECSSSENLVLLNMERDEPERTAVCSPTPTQGIESGLGLPIPEKSKISIQDAWTSVGAVGWRQGAASEDSPMKTPTPTHPRRWRVVDYVWRLCAPNPGEGCTAGLVSAITETVREACRAHTYSSKGCSF